MKPNPLLPVLFLSVLFAGCGPPPPAQRDAKTPAKPAPPAKAGPDIAVTPPRAFDESLLRGKEFLLEASSASAAQARDPDLGVLESDSGIVAAVGRFLRDAAGGQLDAETLAPRWAAYLQNWAAQFHENPPRQVTSVRVGKSLLQEGTVMVPVRLGLGDKAFAGWVVLVREDSGLLVSDVQIVESAVRAAPFDPESPQEISSPSLR